ncbi:MAG: thiamine biosynthesis protein ThiF, partial [Jatrophihabitans endophyticus]|nr:thiamine biosynthesis protein ThiF [Jatrophihabitans endophyticus]
GQPRLGAQVAVLLAAAGVGRVWCATRGSARLAHAAPGGVSPRDEGFELGDVVRAAVARAAPEVDTTPLPLDERPDLTLLVLDGPYDEDRRAGLHADGAAHLCLTAGPDGGVVGPLVLPGLTSCLRCADLHRADRDAAWPLLAAQLRVPRRYGTSSEVACAAVISGTATAQALAYLDGDDPACLDGTIEFHPPDWRLRRRTWVPHPACGCGGWAE